MISYFNGAGIMFWKQEKNTTYVSLGKRNVNPYKGSWSIPGGSMDIKDKGDYLTCAIRETNEEYFSNKKVVKKENISGNNKYIWEIPFVMKYITFFVKVKNLKPNYNFEFSKVDWFDINLIPLDIHPGAEKAINYLKSKI